MAKTGKTPFLPQRICNQSQYTKWPNNFWTISFELDQRIHNHRLEPMPRLWGWDFSPLFCRNLQNIKWNAGKWEKTKILNPTSKSLQFQAWKFYFKFINSKMGCLYISESKQSKGEVILFPSIVCCMTAWQKSCPSANISTNDSTAWQCWVTHCIVIGWKVCSVLLIG